MRKRCQNAKLQFSVTKRGKKYMRTTFLNSRPKIKGSFILQFFLHLETKPKIRHSTVSTPPQERAFLGGGKGIYIFFNFCPITMIQNVNLLYIEWLFRFLKRHTFARALARAKIYWNWSVSKKSHFFMILRNIMAYIFSSIFIQSQWFKI